MTTVRNFHYGLDLWMTGYIYGKQTNVFKANNNFSLKPGAHLEKLKSGPLKNNFENIFTYRLCNLTVSENSIFLIITQQQS